MAQLTLYKTVNKDGEYSCGDIGIATQEWYALLCKDGAQQYIDVLLCFLREPEHTGYCSDVALKYGKNAQHIGSKVIHFSKWVESQLNRFHVIGTDGNYTYWCISMQKGWSTKNGFKWQLRSELVEALQMYLMRNLIDEYKNREPFNGYKELYKWELLKETSNQNVVEIIANLKGQNIVDNQHVDGVFKYLLERKSEELAVCGSHLIDESVPLDKRIDAFKNEMRNMCPSEWKNCAHDERTASAILTCVYPHKYTFYMDTVYQLFCQYLGIERKETGLKYSHFIEIINGLTANYGDEIQNIMLPQIGNHSIKPTNLAVQTLIWCMQDYIRDLLKRSVRNYWLVGYTYGGNKSQFQRFVEDSIWAAWFNESPSDKKQLRLAMSIKSGDVLILKSTSVKGPNHSQPFLRVKAVAIVENDIELTKTTDATLCRCNVKYFGVNDYDFDDATLSSFRKTIHYGNLETKAKPIIEYADSLLTNEYNTNTMNYKPYVDLLLSTRNLILTGAPGTGKTYLADQIAKQLIFGETKEQMTAEEQQQFNEQCGFVQFHPSYDYTDFVEGLRPTPSNDGIVGFERKDGVFKSFCSKAIEKFDTKNFDKAYDDMLESLGENTKILKTPSGKEFAVSANTKGNLKLLTGNEFKNNGVLTREGIKAEFSGNPIYNWWSGYYKGVVKYLEDNFALVKSANASNKKFVFIIDEINRGEMSKIFGELFFSIDPGYRGKKGSVRTQYANMQVTQNYFDQELGISDSGNFGHFFVPENVFIIGTMNDIDRSVESMDFAFRRRFAFKEIKASDSIEMLNTLGLWKDNAISKMKNLNAAIEKLDGLSSAYHIGASYFLKLNYYNGDFDKLWEFHLEGLLREYLRGMSDVENKIAGLKMAYDNASA